MTTPVERAIDAAVAAGLPREEAERIANAGSKTAPVAEVIALRPVDDRVRGWFDLVGWELEPDALRSALSMLGADEQTVGQLERESVERRGLPSGSARYIVIPGWDEFQHYRDRDPVWIKCYTRLLSDDAYLALTAHQRAVLHGLWMQYARSGAHLRLNTRSLSQQLALRVMTRDLEAIKQKGFIEFALAPRKHSASPEKRREEPPISPLGETPTTTTRNRPPRRDEQPPQPALNCPLCGITKKTQQQLDDHLELVHDRTPGLTA